MIRTLGMAGLIGAAGAVAAAKFGLVLPVALDGHLLNGLLFLAVAGIALGFVAAAAWLRGRRRMVSIATLTIAAVLCVLAAFWPEQPARETGLGILSAGDRFWALFDLVLYTVVGLVLMNAGLLSGRRGRGDRDDEK